jgi:hypothetical protein
MPRPVAELWQEGLGEKKYEGDKWGGKYLRAPDIFYTVTSKLQDKLVRLKEVATLRRGFTTGANDFFYLQAMDSLPICPLCGKVHHEALIWRSDGETVKNETSRLIAVKSGTGWEGYIEQSNLKPIWKDVEDLRSHPERLPRDRVFLFQGGAHGEAYIAHGHENGFHLRGMTAGRKPWWSLPEMSLPACIVPAGVSRQYGFYNNKAGCHIDKRLYGLHGIQEDYCALFNNALTFLHLEIFVRTGLGGGLADFTVYEYESALVPNPALFKGEVISGNEALVALGLTQACVEEIQKALEALIEERVTRAKNHT